MNKTKWFMLGILFVMALGFTAFDGHPILPNYLTSPRVRWQAIGDLSGSETSPAVGDRGYTAMWTTLIDANTIKWSVPEDASGAEFRFETDANADSTTIEIWVSASSTITTNAGLDSDTEDNFTLGAILVLTGGQQVASNSNVYFDTITYTNYVLKGTVLDSAADRIGIYKVDLRGYKRVVIIATTLQASTTLYADAKWFPISPTSDGLTDAELRASAISVTESSPITGFATSAKQLADGHNVTVDNAAGTAAVEIQMTSPVKTTALNVIDAWQVVTAATTTVGSVIDLTGAYGDSCLYIEAAQIEATAHAGGAGIKVQVSEDQRTWVDYTATTDLNLTADTAATTTTVGAVTVDVNSVIDLTDATTGDFDVQGRAWFIKDGTIANSEVVFTKSNSTHVVTMMDAVRVSHASGVSVYDRVDQFVVNMREGISYARVVYGNGDGDCDIAVRSRLNKTTAR